MSINWQAAALWLGALWLLFLVIWGLHIWRGR